MAKLTVTIEDNLDGSITVSTNGMIPDSKTWESCTPAEQLTAKVLEYMDSDLTTGLEQVKVN